jgi:solute carrier family 25 (mitochondrial carnitine/acylcarnitine transporter), member 20/29
VLSGALSGIPSAIVVVIHPAIQTVLDHSRFRVALRKEQGEGSVRTAVRIYQQYGFRKLYLGFNCTMLRESFLGVYFGSYDFFMRWFRRDGQVSKAGSFLSGGLAGAATWTIMYPVDYVKTRLQSDSLEKPQYRNSIDCFVKEFGKGYRVIYNGFGIMIFRAFFVNAVGFLAFELAKKAVYQ